MLASFGTGPALSPESTATAIFNLGPMELGILVLILLLLFGGRKLPELARGLGEGLKEFRNASKEAAREEEKPGENGGKAPA